jgi:ATP-binding cassette subfamily F protein 3
MLAFLGWNPGTTQELFSLEDMVQAFTLERVSKAGAKFDADKTNWFQQQYLRAESPVALAKMLLSPANFLIFDEPTNHLDMSSKNILQQAIQQYEGTCVIVSHDRAFLDPIVGKVLEVQKNRVRTYLGNVSYFLDKKKEEAVAEKNKEAKKESVTTTDNGNLSRKEQRRIEAERRNRFSKEINPIKKKMEQIEKDIEASELRKNKIEDLMAEVDFYEDSEKVKKTSLEYEQLKMDLTAYYSKWEEYANRIEAIEKELV